MTRSSSPIPAYRATSQAGRATRPDGLHPLPVRAPSFPAPRSSTGDDGLRSIPSASAGWAKMGGRCPVFPGRAAFIAAFRSAKEARSVTPFIAVCGGLTGRVEHHGDSYVSTRPLRQAAPQKDKNPRSASRARSVGNRASGVRGGLRVASEHEQAAPLNLFGAFTAPRNRTSHARIHLRQKPSRCVAHALHVQSFPVGLSDDEQRTMRKVGDVQFHVGEIQNVEC
jgi:hypothetical protein